MNNDKVITADIEEALLNATSPVDPTPERARAMLAKIKGRVQDAQQKAPDFLTIVRDAGDWMEAMPGNEIKMLRPDETTQSFLVRLKPGGRFPAHSHAEDEETLVLEGEVLFGDLKLRAGDYHLARKDTEHGDVYSQDGCLLFIRASTPDT